MTSSVKTKTKSDSPKWTQIQNTDHECGLYKLRGIIELMVLVQSSSGLYGDSFFSGVIELYRYSENPAFTYEDEEVSSSKDIILFQTADRYTNIDDLADSFNNACNLNLEDNTYYWKTVMF